jgi:hypothetical protein
VFFLCFGFWGKFPTLFYVDVHVFLVFALSSSYDSFRGFSLDLNYKNDTVRIMKRRRKYLDAVRHTEMQFDELSSSLDKRADSWDVFNGVGG